MVMASAVGLAAAAQERRDDAGPDGGGSVVVTGHRPGIAALSETIQNTAQSINVVPQAVLHQQGVTTLQDALKNVPGIGAVLIGGGIFLLHRPDDAPPASA